MARFQAIDGRVQPQQAIAIGLRDFVVGEFALLVITDFSRKFIDQRGGKYRDIFCSRIKLWVWQSSGVGEVAVLHTKFPGLLVHQLGEQVFRAGNAFGQCDGSIVTALDDHAAQQLFNGGRLLRVDKHARALGAPGMFGDR